MYITKNVGYIASDKKKIKYLTCLVAWSCIEILNLSDTLQLPLVGIVCLITMSTSVCGPILPSGSITAYLFGAVHKTTI